MRPNLLILKLSTFISSENLTLYNHTSEVRSLVFTSDGKLESGSSDFTINIWDPLNNFTLTQQ